IAGTYFEHRTKNLIQFLRSSQSTAQARNLASATIRGFEIEGGSLIKVNDLSLNLDCNYTFQWAKDTSGRAGFDGKFLPGRPRHQIHAGLQLSYRWMRFFTDFDFIGDNFLDSFNALKVSHRSLLGMGFSITPWKWIRAGFEVKNVLDQQIEDVVGFPVPGRLFFGKVGILI
ncbi:MAG: TonB-dependent receptor domain-containing protein, partial [Planctomycetota bacterium]